MAVTILIVCATLTLMSQTVKIQGQEEKYTFFDEKNCKGSNSDINMAGIVMEGCWSFGTEH